MITNIKTRYGHLLDLISEYRQSLCDDDIKEIHELIVNHAREIDLLYRERLSTSLALSSDVLAIIFGLLYRGEKNVAFWSQLMGVSRSWYTQCQQSIESLITSTRIVSLRTMNQLSLRYPRLVSLDMAILQPIDFTLFTSLTSLSFKQDRFSSSISKIGFDDLSVLTNLVTLSLPTYVTRIEIEGLRSSTRTMITDLTLDGNNEMSDSQLKSFVNLTRLCILDRTTRTSLRYMTRLQVLEITCDRLPYISGYTGNARLIGKGYCMEGVVTDCNVTGFFSVAFSAGDRFDGNFKNNQRTGHGIYRYVNGTTTEGDWREGVQHGKFIRTGPDGKIITHDWSEGVCYTYDY